LTDCSATDGFRGLSPADLPPMFSEEWHVLVVEDDENFRKLLLSLLRRNGFTLSMHGTAWRCGVSLRCRRWTSSCST
jgi:two-component system OmpR family response regulator